MKFLDLDPAWQATLNSNAEYLVKYSSNVNDPANTLVEATRVILADAGGKELAAEMKEHQGYQDGTAAQYFDWIFTPPGVAPLPDAECLQLAKTCAGIVDKPVTE